MNDPIATAKKGLALRFGHRKSLVPTQDKPNCDFQPAELDSEVSSHLVRYADLLRLSLADLLITTDRRQFEQWLGRRVSATIGGAYVFLSRSNRHAILINLPRIDRAKPRSVELVVAEELIHMRDYLDGDRRRHFKHGYDRIAYRVSELTGASLEDIRGCLIPPKRRPVRYHYACPRCGVIIGRRKRGTWSCGRCSPAFNRSLVLQLVRVLGTEHAET